MSCQKVSNNKFFKCPALMSDGRQFTDYRPNCDLNPVNGINSYNIRQTLINNSVKMMNNNRKIACDNNCCGPCMNPYNKGTMLEEKNRRVCNKESCGIEDVNNEGLGQGTNYGYNSGKCTSWPESLPVNLQSNCCADSNSLFNYYSHINTKAQGELLPRNTVPSGSDALSGGDPVAFNM